MLAENEHVRDLNQLAYQQTFSKEQVVSGNALRFDPPVGSSVGQVSTSTAAGVVSTLDRGNKIFCSLFQRLLGRESKLHGGKNHLVARDQTRLLELSEGPSARFPHVSCRWESLMIESSSKCQESLAG